ncbi:hypothetical protein D5301_05365 [Stenotrophomonas sp. MH181796]|nr:hypothetical protein [Stenotrophomonas sp. MH181796]
MAFTVAADEIRILNAASHAKVTSGPLTVCTYGIWKIAPKNGATSHYLFAHFSNNSTVWDMKRRIQAELVQRKLTDHTIETLAIRTAPDTQVPNATINTLDVAVETSMYFTKGSQSAEYKMAEKAEGAGSFVTECVVTFTPGSEPIVPKYKGMFERARELMFGPGHSV